MKRVLALMLIIIMIGVTACGKGGKESKETESETVESSKKTEVNTEKTEAEEEKATEDVWGVLDEFYTSNGGVLANFYINFPSLTGIPEGSGLVAYQKDDTRVVVDACQNLEISGVDNVFPTAFVQTVDIFRINYGMRYSDGECTLESQETLTVNDYEMCKYVGTHSFKYEGKARSYPFVAYATQLKTNGAYIYWMVLDESADQSLSETIEEYAYKMATTLREE